MAVFKKLKNKKYKHAEPLPDSEPIKQLDERIGLHTYRDFFTLKNYWKAIDRKKMNAAVIMFQRFYRQRGDAKTGVKFFTRMKNRIINGSSVPGQSRNLANSGGGGGGGGGGGDAGVENGEQQKVDPRLPYPNFRELFTLKNYWKTIRRNERDCAKMMLAKYLKQNPDSKEKYPRLKNIDVNTVDAATVDSGFETVAANYLKVFDDVITTVEEKPADVSDACSRLTAVGKMHRAKVNGMDGSEFQLMEEPFLYMINEILQDRYNDKAENLFRKFYQFCLKYILEGFNS